MRRSHTALPFKFAIRALLMVTDAAHTIPFSTPQQSSCLVPSSTARSYNKFDPRFEFT